MRPPPVRASGNLLDYGDVSVSAAAYATLADGAWLADPVLALYCQYAAAALNAASAGAHAARLDPRR